MEKNKGLVSKINKISLPAAILIASLVFGGFYFGSQVIKQNSIEAQQSRELEDKKQAKLADYSSRLDCHYEAIRTAVEKYKETCTSDCKEDYYYTS